MTTEAPSLALCVGTALTFPAMRCGRNANGRDALITGICAECWDTHMTSDEEE